MLEDAISDPNVTVKSLSKAIDLAKMRGGLKMDDPNISLAEGIIAQMKPYEQGIDRARIALEKTAAANDATYESISKAVSLAKRLGGLADDDEVVLYAEERIRVLKAGQKRAFLQSEPLSFQSYDACNCPCADLSSVDGVDRTFRSIINQNVFASFR